MARKSKIMANSTLIGQIVFLFSQKTFSTASTPCIKTIRSSKKHDDWLVCVHTPTAFAGSTDASAYVCIYTLERDTEAGMVEQSLSYTIHVVQPKQDEHVNPKPRISRSTTTFSCACLILLVITGNVCVKIGALYFISRRRAKLV